MRDVKTRAAMEQPKARQKNAMPRTAVRILQRHYARQKQERQTQHQRQPVEYATTQVQQGGLDAVRLTFHATRQLQRKYALHKYRAQKVRQRQETTAGRCASGICGGQRSSPPPRREQQQRHRAPQQCRANRRKRHLRPP